MNNRTPLTAAALVIVPGILVASGASKDDRVDKLSEAHRTWLEEEVPYITSERERDVFLTLASVAERSRFIETFWSKRDPNRSTPINEFKVEHYRRLDHANRFLGRDTFREGWKTARGRYYIILGEPREIQRFDGYNELVSSELWFYQGDPALGLPSFFYLLFFKKGDIGEYRLYDPVIDGPQALLRGNASANAPAVAALREISPELAAASLSFDTSEPPDFAGGHPAMGTALMMARIEESPRRSIRTDYADAYLVYGNRVTADYSFNFVPSRHAFSILVGKDDTPTVHYSIEIDGENFTLETDEDRLRFYTTLDITVEVRTRQGTLVMANDKEQYLELSPSQIQQVQPFPVAYQSDFPLVPGDYEVAIILRNRVSKQYTVAEAEVSIPDVSSGVFIPDVILGFASQMMEDKVPDGEVRTYQIGSIRVQPAAGNLFVIGDTVHILTQVYGAAPGDKVTFDLLDGEEVLLSSESSVRESYAVFDSMKLDGQVGGDYEIRARVQDAAGDVTAEKTTSIRISPRSNASRPSFVYRRGFNTKLPGLLRLARGEQFWNLGRFDEARVELERSVTENPELSAARWKLANAYLRERQPDRALELLAPLEQAFPTQFEVVAGVGFAHYLKEAYKQAVGYLSKARQLRPPDTVLLNTLGDCYQRLGNTEAAREAFEQSLELNASQEAVRNRLAALVRTSDP